MLVLGGKLKRKEMLSGRLGDVFSALYLASMVLKHWEDQGREAADLPLVEWSCRTLLYQAQEQLHGFLRNFPNRVVAAALRVCIFPRGRMYSSPLGELQRVLELAEELLPLEARIRDAVRAGLLPPGDTWLQGPEALARGLVSAAEAAQLAALDAAVQALVAVDDFAPGDLGRAPAA
jgi:acyl-CoA dehydrogenase